MFAVSLVPSVITRAKVPLSTSLPTALVLTVFTGTYVGMQFWYAAAMSAATTACWWALAFRR